MTLDTKKVRNRAWELHREHGHPKDYDGPCWGPTFTELEQARYEERNES